ncbi:hypothetical protein LTR17_019884 [Elasticomyces elasticus]|nr:hypothetical protein LTR17_019884 [Elasticomyces elasticus]
MATVQGSPLLKLAAELRNAIYSEVLIEPGEIKIRKHAMPPLVQTCRQVRTDTLQLYYANNTFRVGDGGGYQVDFCERHIFPWLRCIDVSAVKTLSRIWIDDMYYDSAGGASEALAKYTNQISLAGFEVARETLFIEASQLDAEGDNLGERFWTSDPEKDFASAQAQHTVEEVMRSTY